MAGCLARACLHDQRNLLQPYLRFYELLSHDTSRIRSHIKVPYYYGTNGLYTYNISIVAWVDAFGTKNPVIVPLDWSEDQFQIYQRLAQNYSHCFLFESLSGPEVLSETSIIGFAPEVILQGFADRLAIRRSDGATEEVATDDPLREMQKMIGRNGEQKYRYVGGAVGSVSYDAVRLWEKISEKGPDGPIMEFGIYEDGILYDNKLQKPFYFYYDKDRSSQIRLDSRPAGPLAVSDVTPNIDRDGFVRMVDAAKKYIYDGDIFQAVLSRRFNFEIKGDNIKIYSILRQMNPSPYMYHIKMGDRSIIGSSPEMLVRITGDEIETFPIAGTRKITGDSTQDRALKEELAHDEKELAEHTMLVDLGRNDIGRVCRYGSVHVPELMQIKQFSHVQHMVSHVVGRLDEKYDMYDAFRAVFPAGTVSGAPKVRAMEIIEELEPETRGPYAGAVGYFSFNGCCDFAIAIRSIFIDGDSGFVQSGAGIVSDSVPDAEFDETEHKAGAMIAALKKAGGAS